MITEVEYYQTLVSTPPAFMFNLSKIIPLYHFLSEDKIEEIYYFLTEDKLFFGVILLSDSDPNIYQIQIYTPLSCSSSSSIINNIPNCDGNKKREREEKIKERLKSQKSDIYIQWYNEPKYVENKNVKEYREVLQKIFSEFIKNIQD